MTPLDWHINAAYDSSVIAQSLGAIPTYIDADSADPAFRQFETNFRYGWNPVPPEQGFQLSADEYLVCPGLPPVAPVAYAYHLGEKILVYPAGWTVILQLNGTFSCAMIIHETIN